MSEPIPIAALDQIFRQEQRIKELEKENQIKGHKRMLDYNGETSRD